AVRGLEEFRRTPEYAEAARRWPDVAQSLTRQFQAPGAEATAIKLERIIHDAPHPDRRAWERIQVPTLILGNREDPVHPMAYAEELARVIPGAELREITSKSVNVAQHEADVQESLASFFQRRFGIPPR